MKTVFSNSMVAHVWAQQKQSEGRNSGGSIYFEGDTIYSYGSHFPMAKIIRDTVLFTTQGYSNTTSKHLGHARSAVSHMDVIEVHKVHGTRKENFDQMVKDISHLALKLGRARSSKEWVGKQLADTLSNANKYAKFVKSKRIFTLPANIGELVKEDRERSKAETAKRKAATLKRKQELQEYLDRWEAGVGDYLGGFHKLPVRLRINGDKLETSHGAECPLKFGKRAYLQAKICKAKNITWVSNGHTIKLGHFQIDTITASGTIVAGCHTIPFEETLRIAKKAGWVK